MAQISRQKIRRRAHHLAVAQRQRLLAGLTAIVIALAIFEAGYLYRQVTHPEHELVIQTVDESGNVLATRTFVHDSGK